MRVRRRFWLLAALGLIGSTIFGAYLFERSSFMQADSERTRQAVLARIPIGTDIAKAQKIMEADGFTCTKMFARHVDADPADGRNVTYPPAHILWCDSKERWTPALLISKRWQVTFVATDHRAARITVGVGLTGP